MLKWLIAALLALLLIAGVSQAGEVLGGGDSSGGGDSGTPSSHRAAVEEAAAGKSISIDCLKPLQDGKKSKPAKFEELRTLLWKDPITKRRIRTAYRADVLQRKQYHSQPKSAS